MRQVKQDLGHHAVIDIIFSFIKCAIPLIRNTGSVIRHIRIIQLSKTFVNRYLFIQVHLSVGHSMRQRIIRIIVPGFGSLCQIA